MVKFFFPFSDSFVRSLSGSLLHHAMFVSTFNLKSCALSTKNSMHQKWVVKREKKIEDFFRTYCIHVCLGLQFLIFSYGCDCRASQSMLQKESGCGKAEHRRLVLAHPQTNFLILQREGWHGYGVASTMKEVLEIHCDCGDRSLEKAGLEPYGIKSPSQSESQWFIILVCNHGTDQSDRRTNVARFCDLTCTLGQHQIS